MPFPSPGDLPDPGVEPGSPALKADALPSESPDAKSWLIGRDPDAGKDWKREEKGATEDELVGWHHRNGTWVWVNSGSWWWTGSPGMLWFMGSQKSQTRLSDWTELNWMIYIHHYNIQQNSFIAIKILFALFIHPSVPWPLSTTEFFNLHNFDFLYIHLELDSIQQFFTYESDFKVPPCLSMPW